MSQDTRRKIPQTSYRNFSSTSALSSGTTLAQDGQPPSHQRAQTLYDLFPQTFPQGPPPASDFQPDLKQLRSEFLALQSKSHPDVATPGNKRHAEALSMRINEAYNTLANPLKRAQYLLSLQGIDVEDDSAKLSDSELLMEVMEVRERVDEVENDEALGKEAAENDVRIKQAVRALGDAFAAGEYKTAATEAVRLRYWMNIHESIRGD